MLMRSNSRVCVTLREVGDMVPVNVKVIPINIIEQLNVRKLEVYH